MSLQSKIQWILCVSAVAMALTLTTFARADSTFATQHAKLVAADAAIDQRFGQAVALSEDILVVGAIGDPGGGAVYVFSRSGVNWVQQSKLLPADRERGDLFGESVAVHDNTIVVGAPGDDSQTGGVYVFARRGNEWLQQAKFRAHDPSPGDRFGDAVALGDAGVVVGAAAKRADAGAVYIFEKRDNLWRESQKLLSADAKEGDRFGYALALAGDWLAVGQPGASEDQGEVRIFRRDNSKWTKNAEIEANEGNAGDQFGSALSLSSQRLVIGAPSATRAIGKAYVYSLEEKTWTLHSTLVTPDAREWGFFGNALTQTTNSIFVGAPGMRNTAHSEGRVYGFELRNEKWSNVGQIGARSGGTGDFFGGTIARDNDFVVVGSLGDAEYGHSSGAAFLYRITLASVAQSSSSRIVSATIDQAPGWCGDGKVDLDELCDPGVSYRATCPEGWGLCRMCNQRCDGYELWTDLEFPTESAAQLVPATKNDPPKLFCELKDTKRGVSLARNRYDEHGFYRGVAKNEAHSFAESLNFAGQSDRPRMDSHALYNESGQVVLELVPNPKCTGACSGSAQWSIRHLFYDREGRKVGEDIDRNGDGVLEQFERHEIRDNSIYSEYDNDGDGIVDRTVWEMRGSKGRVQIAESHRGSDGAVDARDRIEYNAVGKIVVTSSYSGEDGVLKRQSLYFYGLENQLERIEHDDNGDGQRDRAEYWKYDTIHRIIRYEELGTRKALLRYESRKYDDKRRRLTLEWNVADELPNVNGHQAAGLRSGRWQYDLACLRELEESAPLRDVNKATH